MLRASYRSAPRLWLPTAVVRLPGWKISACVKMHLAAGDFVAGCEAEPRGEVLGARPRPQILAALADELQCE